MFKAILKKAASKKQLLLVLLVPVVLVAFVFVLFLSIDKPKAMIVHAPQSLAFSNTTAISYNEPIQRDFIAISPASFSAIFGIDYKEIVRAVPTVEPEKKKKIIIKNKLKQKNKPKKIDLRSLGYRLTGMITGDKETVLFLYDPVAKKNKILRKNASDSIKIVNTLSRSVELVTPKGRGILKLENSKTFFSNGLTHSAGVKRGTHIPVAMKEPKKDLSSQYIQRPVTAQSMISAGDLRPSRIRGSREIGLKVKSVPSALKDFSIQKGDVIMGSEQSSFSSMQDANNTFRTMKERPTILRIMRGRKTLYLKNKTKVKRK